MKKFYEDLLIETIAFSEEDILTASSDNDGALDSPSAPVEYGWSGYH